MVVQTYLKNLSTQEVFLYWKQPIKKHNNVDELEYKDPVLYESLILSYSSSTIP